MPLDTLAGTDTERAPDSLRADLEAQFTAAEEPTDEVSAPTSSGDVRVDDGPVDGSIEGRAEKDRARAPDGKFTKSTDKAAPEKVAAATDSPSTDTQTKASDPASTPTIAPPAGWTAAAKADWSKLPPSVQAEVSRREADMTNGGKQWSEEKRRYEAALSPIAQLARARGISAEEGAQRLAQAQQMLDADPVNGIRKLAASYGVNLATIAGTPAAEGSSDQNPYQPDISALVRAQVEPLLAPIRQQREEEQRHRENQTVEIVTTFASSPGHEHFDAVQTELMALIPAIKNQNPAWSHEKVLQDAYDRAVYANPTTRAAVTQTARDAEQARLRIEAAARTDKARRAGSSVTGSPSGSVSTAPKDSIRGELEAAFAGSA